MNVFSGYGKSIDFLIGIRLYSVVASITKLHTYVRVYYFALVVKDRYQECLLKCLLGQ